MQISVNNDIEEHALPNHDDDESVFFQSNISDSLINMFFQEHDMISKRLLNKNFSSYYALNRLLYFSNTNSCEFFDFLLGFRAFQDDFNYANILIDYLTTGFNTDIVLSIFSKILVSNDFSIVSRFVVSPVFEAIFNNRFSFNSNSTNIVTYILIHVMRIDSLFNYFIYCSGFFHQCIKCLDDKPSNITNEQYYMMSSVLFEFIRLYPHKAKLFDEAGNDIFRLRYQSFYENFILPIYDLKATATLSTATIINSVPYLYNFDMINELMINHNSLLDPSSCISVLLYKLLKQCDKNDTIFLPLLYSVTILLNHSDHKENDSNLLKRTFKIYNIFYSCIDSDHPEIPVAYLKIFSVLLDSANSLLTSIESDLLCELLKRALETKDEKIQNLSLLTFANYLEKLNTDYIKKSIHLLYRLLGNGTTRTKLYSIFAMLKTVYILKSSSYLSDNAIEYICSVFELSSSREFKLLIFDLVLCIIKNEEKTGQLVLLENIAHSPLLDTLNEFCQSDDMCFAQRASTFMQMYDRYQQNNVV